RNEEPLENLDAGFAYRPEIPAVERGLKIALGEMGARIGDFVEIEPDQLALLDDLPDGVDRMQSRELAHRAAPIFPLRVLLVHADNLLPHMEAHRLAPSTAQCARVTPCSAAHRSQSCADCVSLSPCADASTHHHAAAQLGCQ